MSREVADGREDGMGSMHERAAARGRPRAMARRAFYLLKPLLPRRVQIAMRRAAIRVQQKRHAAVWPIDPACAGAPAGFPGWPSGKQFAFVLTHDVETAIGRDRCLALQDLDRTWGFRSSFNFVPERYHVPAELRARLVAGGGEIGVHGLKHDGKLFSSWKVFEERAARINGYLAEWGAVGFRAPAMHHNLDWIRHLDIEYDESTFDTDPFEAQPDGVRAVFPFWVPPAGGRAGYVELPYTLPQDFTLFVLMKQPGIVVWARKLDWLAARGGMALVDAHPDYMCFGPGAPRLEEYPVRLYEELLRYVSERYAGACWNPLPRELARFWREAIVHPAVAAVTGGVEGARHTP
jgi:hypothetical protein